MTSNQIEFAKLVEQGRHNLAGESETHRSNKANEALGMRNYKEVARSNRANESIKRQSNKLTRRGQNLNEKQSKRQAATSKYVANKQLEGTKYSADRNYQGTVYNADRNLEGTKYSADRNLEGNRYAAEQNRAGRENAASITGANNITIAGMTNEQRTWETKYKAMVDKTLKNMDNSTTKYVANLNNMAKDKDRQVQANIAAVTSRMTAIMNSAQRRHWKSQDDVSKFQAEINNFAAKAEADYKKGKLTLDAIKEVRAWLQTMTGYLNSIEEEE